MAQPGTEYDKLKTYTLTPTGVFLRKGEEIGMFQMGSTIALLFECPESTQFTVGPGDKLRMGQKLT